MATNTKYNPVTLAELDSGKLEGAGQGVSAICNANGTTNLDIVLADDMIVTGLHIVVNGASLGDWAELKVLLTANGATLKTPIPKWYLPITDTLDFAMVMPVKATSAMTLRVVVHTTVVLVTPYVAVNYKLWKILV